MKPSRLSYRSIFIATAVTLIVIACATLGLSLWEAFGGLTSRVKIVELPGFHELKLDTPGLYVGVYQHRGSGPIPTKALSSMDVRIMTKDRYEEVPVLMNNTGQTFSQLGMQGMPLFNFEVQEPGVFTLSAVYLGGNTTPTVPVIIFAQTAQNIKQTLIVGIAFFALFLALGIIMLVRLNQWAPKSGPHATPARKEIKKSK